MTPRRKAELRNTWRYHTVVTECLDEIDRLRRELEAIRDSDHCQYNSETVGHRTSDRSYGIGVADGHRCAANMARRALE